MRRYRNECVVAGVLFITATTATMASQILIGPMLSGAGGIASLPPDRAIYVTGVLLEVVNALSSAGIAIALFPVIWRFVQGSAVAYVGLRVIEASMGLLAAVAALGLLTVTDPEFGLMLHHWAFMMVLLVFSVSTLVLYPTLFRFRLVPVVLSLWGLLGGLMLMLSVVLILFGRIEMGSTVDLFLSLPIWINEMALALWLILRGVDLTRVTEGGDGDPRDLSRDRSGAVQPAPMDNPPPRS